jgi:hypothetical protein
LLLSARSAVPFFGLAPLETNRLQIIVCWFLDLLVVEKVFTALARSVIRGLQQL